MIRPLFPATWESFRGGSMLSKKNSIILPTVVILFAFSLVSAFAQGFGTLVGTITDPSGSVIPGVKVTVTDQGTQTARSVLANAQGYYVIPSLHPSTYDLTASTSGFATHEQKDVTLLADQSLTVDIRMTIGRITETVSVQSNSIQVDTTTSALSQVVEEKRIEFDWTLTVSVIRPIVMRM